MTIKKFTAILLSAVLICTTFTACSSKKSEETVEPTSVTEVADEDDGVRITASEQEQTTFTVTDKQDNVLTVVPIYNSDGVTIIAGYIQSAKDKDGKDLTEQEYSYIKAVVAVDVSTETVDDEEKAVYNLRYSDDDKIVTITALCDENGYIIALQDAIDIDGDKDTTEYFKVETKLDNNNNLFIKLSKDDNGKLINVTVETSSDNKTVTVVDENGNKTNATNSKNAKNLKEVAEKNNSSSDSNNSSSGNSGSASNSGNGQSSSNQGSDNNSSSGNNASSEDETVDYVSIVLMDNGKVSCSAKNVTVNEASAVNGGTEVVVNGAGDYSKYYVTSQTGTFSGQIEFRFSVGEDVDVKFYNVNISTAKKTAVKFTNVDSEVDKDVDSEESGVGNITTDVDIAAPEVQLSLTGSNSFKANGSGKNGTIYSECKLAIKGHGSAEIDGGSNLSGICSTESITIKNATLDIVSRAKQGISCDKKVTINSGATINIESTGDGIHCNKFLLDGASDDGDDSVVTIKSMNSDSADGIDASEELIVNGGTLNVVALTRDKYALKCRKVIKGKNGVFTINGGTVTASGYNNTTLQNGTQKAVLVKSSSACVFTVGGVSSSETYSFICSPANVDSVTSSVGGEKAISWVSNAGSVTY